MEGKAMVYGAAAIAQSVGSRVGETSDAADAVDAVSGATALGFADSATASADRVAETVDAVTGATWTTRNTIMARLFAEDLATRGDEMPAFRPAGT